MVGTASYCYFAAFLNHPPAATAVVQSQSNRPLVAHEVPAPDKDHNEVAQAPAHDPVDNSQSDPAPPPKTEKVARQKPVDATPPAAPSKEEPVFTSESMEMFTELKSITPSPDLPVTFKLRDLQQDAAHKKLVGELQKDSVVRLELPVPNGSRAFERMRSRSQRASCSSNDRGVGPKAVAEAPLED